MAVRWGRVLAIGTPIAVLGLVVLAASSAEAMPTEPSAPPRPSSGGSTSRGPGGLLLIDRSDRPRPASFKGRDAARDVSKVNTIVVHQTDARGGFGLAPYQLRAVGGDPVAALLARYEETPYHGIASARDGRQLSVWQWPASAYSYHGHGGNSNSVGWAYDGKFPGDSLDVSIARQSFAHAVERARAQGAPIKYVEAHRQHDQDRGGDPGPEIWREVVLPMLGPLGLELSPRVTGSGSPIPSSWS